MDVPLEDIYRKLGELLVENMALKLLVARLEQQLPDLEDILIDE